MTQGVWSQYSSSDAHVRNDPPQIRMQQQLVDHGLALGGLMSDLDQAGFQQGEMASVDALIFIHRFVDIRARLDAWYHTFLSLVTGSLYWPSDETSYPRQSLLSSMTGSIDDTPAPAPFNFPSLRLAATTAIYWALKVLVSTSINKIKARHLQGNTSNVNEIFEEQQTSYTAAANAQGVNPESLDAASYETSWLINDPIILATNIIRTMPYCLSDSQGVVGAQQSLFALRIALLVLQRSRGIELQWCKSMYNLLSEKKGVMYAREIEKLDGGHGDRGAERAGDEREASQGEDLVKVPYDIQGTVAPSK